MMPDAPPCHHVLVQYVDRDTVADHMCVRSIDHRGSHRDDEDRRWPRETCDTDLHETTRAVVRLEDAASGRAMSLCALCVGRMFLHAQDMWRRLRRAVDEHDRRYTADGGGRARCHPVELSGG